jgi:hypothetical protein
LTAVMPWDAYSPRKYPSHIPMRAKYCQPSHPVQKEGRTSVVLGQIGTRQIKQVTYAKCEVKYYLVGVKVIGVVAKVRAHGEIGGRGTPTGVRVERSSS